MKNEKLIYCERLGSTLFKVRVNLDNGKRVIIIKDDFSNDYHKIELDSWEIEGIYEIIAKMKEKKIRY